MPAFDAVLFDFGDTLFGRAGGPAAIQDVARTLGHTVAAEEAGRVWAEIQAHARTPAEMARGRDLSAAQHRESWLSLYAAADVLGAGLAELLYEREVSPEHWEVFAATRTVLRALSGAGIGVGIVSDTGFDIRPVFARHRLDRHVGVWVLSYEQGRTKPAPELFLGACEQLGAAPGRTLMVGDNALTDGGAVEAGLSVLLLPAASRGERLRAVLDVAGLATDVPARH